MPVSGLSIYDPIHFGIDELGRRVEVALAYRTLLVAGEPGAGKSSLLNTILGHAALSTDCRLWLFDGKRVELSPWREIADVFVGNSITDGIAKLAALQHELDIRYALMEAARPQRRKILPSDHLEVIVCVIDELAYFSAIAGTEDQQKEFYKRLLDIVNRGRAAGIITIVATQRPSADIIKPAVRDLFSWRAAFRCNTHSSSDIILSPGWAKEGYSAKNILPEEIGIGLLLAEGGTPFKFKAAYLTDDHIRALVSFARDIRTAA